MEWIFDGIGTAIIIFILGLVIGAEGYKFYINKQTQKAGKKSVQIQSSGKNEGNISADKISGDKNSPGGDFINGVKIISSKPDEFDICNFSSYSITQIEDVIAKGDSATLRKWCLELIINQKPKYLIQQCIEKMDNNEEKYMLLEELSKRDFDDSEYFVNISQSLSNAVYQTKAIKLLLSRNKDEYIEPIFVSIQNNRYIYESLIAIYEYNKDIFDKLYRDGNCFSNEQYKTKMINFLEERGRSNPISLS